MEESIKNDGGGGESIAMRGNLAGEQVVYADVADKVK